MQRLLETLMSLEGDEVVAVSRPEEIIPMAEREKPDLILMDFHLAGGNALDPLAALKAHEMLRGIPVLVTSGMDEETRCLEAGADGFILKPFRPSNLLERVGELLNDREPKRQQPCPSDLDTGTASDLGD